MKHKNTQPLYIFNRENPQNSEPQNGPWRGLDYIALAIGDHHFFTIPCHCQTTKLTKDLCKASTYIDSRLVVTDVGNNFGRSDDDMF